MTDPVTETEPSAPMEPEVDPAIVLLKWRSHPMRDRRERMPLVLVILIGLPLFLWWLYGLYFGLLALVILGGSLGSFFLPTDYILYTGGGEMKFLGIVRRFRWTQFRSFYPDRNGVLLSPFARPSRLENFRGVYLRFGQRADEIMDVVTARMELRREGLVEEPPA